MGEVLEFKRKEGPLKEGVISANFRMGLKASDIEVYSEGSLLLVDIFVRPYGYSCGCFLANKDTLVFEAVVSNLPRRFFLAEVSYAQRHYWDSDWI